ncbi:LOW QUALITY PROTEIN: hypothetical protein Cgig2_001376 [Carnegiea gigantea]|uniref:Spermidine hydroxycinnamoyl transferase n=1 Tax=Carnegiea gigantea TaxID=171969 RepID=A0A9Q1KTT2_9CARY|nr:LOW QUALITY PROTEIN: hypothetical protein Cgig2_001376 [Carnegiea gigantea]
MGVNIKASHIIKPSEPTWEGVSSLSDWDQIGVTTHILTIYFYKPSKEWLESSNLIFDTLKGAMSCALLVVSGGYIGQGRLELLCNGSGVELIEAESNFGDFSCTSQFKDLVPDVDYDKPIDELPLMYAQVTVFCCGGISLGVTVSHIVADGRSALHFMKEWARLARGEPIEMAPYIDYTLLKAQDSPRVQIAPGVDLIPPVPLVIGKENSLEERKKPTMVSIPPLTKEQDAEKVHPYSRYEVVAAHVWRSACKARGHQDEQPTGLGFSIDIRGLMNPPLPSKYFGNAILDVCGTRFGEIKTQPLRCTCGKMGEAIEKANDEYVWANSQCFKTLPDFTPFQDLHSRKKESGPLSGPFYGNPNIGVISWLNLPIYGLDFGWGKEIHMGPGTHDSDGDVLVLPGPLDDGSLTIALCLQVAHTDDFKKYFYENISCKNQISS